MNPRITPLAAAPRPRTRSGFRLGTGLLLALAILPLASCDSVPIGPQTDDGQWLPAPTGQGLVADPQSPIPDVPKPIGFLPVVNRCSSTVADGIRLVSHLYQGRGDIADTVAFFRRELRRHHWLSLSEETRSGVTIMRSRKGLEALDVEISQPTRVISVVVKIDRPPATIGLPKP